MLTYQACSLQSRPILHSPLHSEISTGIISGGLNNSLKRFPRNQAIVYNTLPTGWLIETHMGPLTHFPLYLSVIVCAHNEQCDLTQRRLVCLSAMSAARCVVRLENTTKPGAFWMNVGAGELCLSVCISSFIFTHTWSLLSDHCVSPCARLQGCYWRWCSCLFLRLLMLKGGQIIKWIRVILKSKLKTKGDFAIWAFTFFFFFLTQHEVLENQHW